MRGCRGLTTRGDPNNPAFAWLAGAHARPPGTVPRRTARTEHPRSRPEPVPAPRLWRMSTQAGMPLRDYRIHRYVNAFCPQLPRGRPRSAALRGRRLSAGSRCGTAASGWSADAPTTASSARCTTSRRDPPLPRAVDRADEGARARTSCGNFKPVPSAYEDGLPQMQTQHTCILLEDLTDHCNLRCPTCFAESSAGAARSRRSPRCSRRSTPAARENDRIDVLMLRAASRRSIRGSSSCSTPSSPGRSCAS